MVSLREWLALPELQRVNPDADERLEVHQRILRQKPLVRRLFTSFYDSIAAADRTWFGDTPGPRIEIGAGTSFLREVIPGIVVTDVVPASTIDAVVDAQHLPFADASLRAIYGIFCFHHLARPYQFLSEFVRAVRPGGGCVLIEPYWSPLARIVYQRIFPHEYFDMTADAQASSADHGPMTDANQALSYIVFERDRERLARDFPQVEIVHHDVFDSTFSYLLSGGLNFRQLVPNAAVPLLGGFEHLLRPARKLYGLHHILVLWHRPQS